MQHFSEPVLQALPRSYWAEISPTLLFAKAAGAFAGSLISIAYLLPRGRREAMLRLTVGMVSGIVFGGPAGLKIADALDLPSRLSLFETSLMGAAATSLSAWWALGLLHRFAEKAPVGAMPTMIGNAFHRADASKKDGS